MPRLSRRLAAHAAALLSFTSLAAQEPPPGPAPVVVASGNAGKNYLNLSLDGLIVAGTSTEPDLEGLEQGGHDPAQRGFTLQGVEVVFDGAVDPYFRAQANAVLQITPDGETNVELEEAFATTSALPHNVQLKAGQYLSEFGRVNPTHPHAWDFVDQPMVSSRMFGADGLRSVGVRASWLMPTPFYSELFLSMQNAHGETLAAFGNVEGETYFGRPIVDAGRGAFSDFLYVPRWVGSFDLTDTQTLLVGVSGAYGPNGTGDGASTTIGGLDAFWKWKSARANKGFPFVKVQFEAMARRYEAAATETLAADTFDDHGGYLQAVWGPKPGWTVGARLERVGGDVGDDPADPRFDPRWRASLQASWYPTEYSKIRLQYSRDDRSSYPDAHTIWLQFEFLLGAHAAHKF